MLKLLFSFLFLFQSIASAQTPQNPNQPVYINPPNQNVELPLDIQIIMDFSGSMNALMGSVKKMDAARSALAKALSDIPPNSLVAFRAYGHNYGIQDKEKSCKDTQLVIPYGPLNKDNFVITANNLMPNGMTPIAYSLWAAGEDLKMRPNFKHLIIFISDGEETCGGNPAQTTQDLISQGIKVNVYTIGFDVNDLARSQLQGVAAVSGGKYYDANSSDSLAATLKQITLEAVPQKKAINELQGEARIKGGDNYETAAPFPVEFLNKEVSFMYHIKGGSPEFFYIDVKPGYTLKIKAALGEKGVKIDEFNRAEESDNPHLDLEVDNFERTKLGSIYLYGNNATETLFIPEQASNKTSEQMRHYILVGNKEGGSNIHRNTRLKIELLDETDAGSGTDAPDDVLKNPPEIKLGQEYKGYLSKNDEKDFYKVAGLRRGQMLQIVITPIAAEDDFQMGGVFNSMRVKVKGSASSPNRGAPAIGELTIPEDGDYFFEVNDWYSSTRPGEQYSIKILEMQIGSNPENSVPVNKTETPNVNKNVANNSAPTIQDSSGQLTWRIFLKQPVLNTVLIETGLIILQGFLIYYLFKAWRKAKKNVRS